MNCSMKSTPGLDFIKQFTPYAWNLRSAPILFEQIYSNVASCIYALRSTFCIGSQILGALYALRPAPNFYEIHPRTSKVRLSRFPNNAPKAFLLTTRKIVQTKNIDIQEKNVCCFSLNSWIIY
jgi:hypothetical protein